MKISRDGAAHAALKRVALAAALLAAPALGVAGPVSHQYTPLGGSSWALDLAVTNDGSVPAFAGFSVYFAPLAFSNLHVAASPAGWDSIVLPPDLGLPAPGLFDTLATDVASIPVVGGTQSGFRVTFDWSGVGVDPGQLRYTLNDANFNVLAEGLTVPEAPSAFLAALGLAALGLVRQQTSRKPTQATTESEVCA